MGHIASCVRLLGRSDVNSIVWHRHDRTGYRYHLSISCHRSIVAAAGEQLNENCIGRERPVPKQWRRQCTGMHRYLAPHTAAATLGVPTHSHSRGGVSAFRGLVEQRDWAGAEGLLRERTCFLEVASVRGGHSGRVSGTREMAMTSENSVLVSFPPAQSRIEHASLIRFRKHCSVPARISMDWKDQFATDTDSIPQPASSQHIPASQHPRPSILLLPIRQPAGRRQ